MPAQNEQEASLVKGGDLLVAPNLSELIKHLSAHEPNDVRCPAPQKGAVRPVQQSTYGQIIGQLGAKKGLFSGSGGPVITLLCWGLPAQVRPCWREVLWTYYPP